MQQIEFTDDEYVGIAVACHALLLVHSQHDKCPDVDFVNSINSVMQKILGTFSTIEWDKVLAELEKRGVIVMTRIQDGEKFQVHFHEQRMKGSA